METKPDLTQALRCDRLICVDAVRNSNKQWIGWVLPSGDLYVEYGRVGYSQKSHLYICASVRSAEYKLDSLVREKLGKGYQQVEAEAITSEALDFRQLEQSEAKAIERRLERLQQRGEVIQQFTTIAFDPIRGLFTTQIGVVSSQTIAQARQALRRVESRVGLQRGNQQFIAAVEDYLAIVPLKVGMTLDPYQVLGSTRQVAAQFSVLDEVELALAEIGEIRKQIHWALGQEGAIGSEERARWLQWGAIEESEPGLTVEVGDRAQWSRWQSSR